MAFAILRTRKISTPAQMSGMQRHNDRTNNVLNADKDLQKLNHTYSITKTGDLRSDIETRISDSGAKVKKNSVLAIEHLMTFSPDYVKLEKYQEENGSFGLRGVKNGEADKWNDFKKGCADWLKKTYGKENIVHISYHLDEKTPHIHAYVVPLKEKEVKWKNKNGEGVKKVASLCARDYLGGKEKMQLMQDSFHSEVEHLGLERGKKGSLAKHEHIQKYYERVNKSIEFHADIDRFKPFTQSVELSDPPLFGIGKAEWKANEEIKLQELMKQQQLEAINDFRRNFEGDFERMLESKKKTSDLSREISSLSNELSQKADELVKTKLTSQNTSKRLDEFKVFSIKLQNAAIAAVKNQDPKAIQAIMNLHDKEIQQVNKPKDKGMSR